MDRTALVYAIVFEKFEIAKKLIRLGADVRAEDSLGQTALHFAVTSGRDINELSARHDCRFGLMYESVNFALSARDEKVLKELKEANAQQKDKVYDSAARLSLVQELLNAGADVNHKDRNGCSPIQCAVCTGDLELAKMLIDAGADVDSKNSLSTTALHNAMWCHNEAMIHLLLNHGRANVEVKTSEGDTLLHCLAWLNRKTSYAAILGELLLKFSGHVNAENAYGKTPFHYIIQYADLNMVKRFIELGADIKKADQFGLNALYYAVYNEVEVLNLILESAGPTEILIDQWDNSTALNRASGSAKLDHVRLLIASGADVNRETPELPGNTPLESCMQHYKSRDDERRTQTANLLLESGAEVNNYMMFPQLFGGGHPWDIGGHILLELVAIIEARTNKAVLDEHSLALIESRYARFKIHYDKCQAELQAMKNHNIKDTSISYFTILTEPVKLLARNKAVVKEFETNDFQIAYPLYSSYFRKNIISAINEQKALEIARIILCMTLQFGDPSDAFYEITAKYLGKANIKFLIDSALNDDFTLQSFSQDIRLLSTMLHLKYLLIECQK